MTTSPTDRSDAAPTTRTPRLAANPIPYWSRGGVVDKSKEVFDEAFADFQQIGFTAVKADLPEGMTAPEYRSWIGSYGLAPAISTVMAPFDDGVVGLTDPDRAKRFAADQLALGNDVTMVIAPMTPTRVATPAVAVDHSSAQLEATTENLGLLSELFRAEGLYPTIHPHVGSLVESETELRHVLDVLGPERLGFGPDTGHMAWAGMDPATLIRDYADRVRGIHVKDVFPDFLADDPGERRDKAAGRSYHEMGATRRLWAEPGLGVMDIDAVVAAMPREYAGDWMVEVDVPSVDSRFESHQMSYDWARTTLTFLRG